QLEFGFSEFFCSLGSFDSFASANVVVNVEAENDGSSHQQSVSGGDQQKFQQQHGIPLPNSETEPFAVGSGSEMAGWPAPTATTSRVMGKHSRKYASAHRLSLAVL